MADLPYVVFVVFAFVLGLIGGRLKSESFLWDAFAIGIGIPVFLWMVSGPGFWQPLSELPQYLLRFGPLAIPAAIGSWLSRRFGR